MILISAFIFIFITISEALDLPFNICKQNDPNLSQCVNEAAVQAIVSMANGVPSLNVLPLEPLGIDNMSIGESGSIASFKQNYRNIKVYGLTKGLNVSNYEIDFDNLIFKSDSFNPQIDFVANCKVDGRLLLFRIHGQGPCNITMLNLKTKNTYYGEKFEKDNNIYMKLKRYDVKFKPDKVILNFERLFSQDSFLGNQINSILNSNSDVLFRELQSSYEDTFSKVFMKIGNDVFSRIPFDNVFPA
ncbi:protein takeout [Microplitis demolitor]|uniref:protein takeout n=1 Tax=Microplitis demolitor TaxID=69319 RepID=UPI00044000B1|nr:protein takeout [Microplitis demolitor]